MEQEIFKKWKNELKPEKYKRGYQHIDEPIDLSEDKNFLEIIKSIKSIENHQFLPFLMRVDKQEKYKRIGPNNNRRIRNYKNRIIMYACHKDAHIYSFFNFYIGQFYEKFIKDNQIDKNVIAYRKIVKFNGKGKSNIDFSKEAFDEIRKYNKECVVITHDISGFFDNLNHRILKQKICKILNVSFLEKGVFKIFESITRYKFISLHPKKEKNRLLKSIKLKMKNQKTHIFKILKNLFQQNLKNIGIPQGSPISGLFANIYMIDFDINFTKTFPDIFYRRYSDDIIFIIPIDKTDEILNYIEIELQEKLKLKVQPAKGFITHFLNENNVISIKNVSDANLDKNERIEKNRNYLDYLGFEFNGNISLRKATIQKFNSREHKKLKREAKTFMKEVKKEKPILSSEINSKTIEHNRKRKPYYFRAAKTMNSNYINKQLKNMKRNKKKIKKKFDLT